jgi:hypothetical protein
VEEISELDTKLLEVFCSGVAIAFDNILLTEITDTQAELILRLGDVVNRAPTKRATTCAAWPKCATCWPAPAAARKKPPCCSHAAPMHDIGKIATPDAVLLKPGKLDAAEWKS